MVGQLAKLWGAKRIIGSDSQWDKRKQAREAESRRPLQLPCHSTSHYLDRIRRWLLPLWCRCLCLCRCLPCRPAVDARKSQLAVDKFAYDACLDTNQHDTLEKVRAELKRINPEGFDLYWVSQERARGPRTRIRRLAAAHLTRLSRISLIHLVVDACIVPDFDQDGTGGPVTWAFYEHPRKFARVVLCGQISEYEKDEEGKPPLIPNPFKSCIFTSVKIQGQLTQAERRARGRAAGQAQEQTHTIGSADSSMPPYLPHFIRLMCLHRVRLCRL
jgi:hypothetical protein